MSSGGQNTEKLWEGVFVSGKKILYLVNGRENPIFGNSSSSSSSTAGTTGTIRIGTGGFGRPGIGTAQSQDIRFNLGGAGCDPNSDILGLSRSITGAFQPYPPPQSFRVVEDDDEEEEGQISTAGSNLNSNPPSLPQFFLSRSVDWKLKGEMCFNVESTSLFHLKIGLSFGRSPECVKMVLSISKCPEARVTQPFNLPSQLQLHFLDEHEKTLQSNYIHIPSEWRKNKRREVFEIVNEVLMSTETLQKVCQFKRKGNALLLKHAKNIKTENGGINSADIEFEFIKCVVEVDMKVKSGENSTLLKSGACNVDNGKYLPSASVSLNLTASKPPSGSAGLTVDPLAQPFKFKPPEEPGKKPAATAGFNFVLVDSPPIFGSDQNEDKSQQKEKDKTRSKFSEMIKFQVGPNSEEFYVHREILTKKSPVFERMLTVEMKEKNKGMISLTEEDPEIVQKFINYLYTEKLDQGLDENSEAGDGDLKCLDVVELLDLLKFAHMYEIMDLLSDVTGLIVAAQNESLVLEVVLAIFLAGCQFEIQDLKFRALQWIKLNKSSILSSEGQKVFKLFMKGKDEVVSTLLFQIL